MLSASTAYTAGAEATSPWPTVKGWLTRLMAAVLTSDQPLGRMIGPEFGG